MDRITLSNSLEFSRIIYGMWRLGGSEGETPDPADLTPDAVERKVMACLDQGITTFDQAAIYGGFASEALFGNVLKAKPSLRDQMEIVTKFNIIAPVGRHADAPIKYYDTSAAGIEYSVECSLKEMGIEHIDLLLVHRPDPFMDHEETGAKLDELVKAGKVGHIGASNFRAHDWELLQSGMSNPLLTNQIEVSLGQIAPFSNGDVAYHQKNKQPIMAWSPLGGGGLMTGSGTVQSLMDDIAAENGVDRAAVATAFLLAHPANILPVMGTNNLERISSISDALKVKMDRITWFRLYEAALGTEVP